MNQFIALFVYLIVLATLLEIASRIARKHRLLWIIILPSFVCSLLWGMKFVMTVTAPKKIVVKPYAHEEQQQKQKEEEVRVKLIHI